MFLRPPATAHLDPILPLINHLPGKIVQPVVERTFGWMTRWRRLVRDYEVRLDVSGAMIHVSMGALMLRRLAHPEK